MCLNLYDKPDEKFARFTNHQRSVGEIHPAEGVRLVSELPRSNALGLMYPVEQPPTRHQWSNVVPAQVAGVRRILVTSPPRTLAENPAVAAALSNECDRGHAVGGAQAIAAWRMGTETIPRVE